MWTALRSLCLWNDCQPDTASEAPSPFGDPSSDRAHTLPASPWTLCAEAPPPCPHGPSHPMLSALVPRGSVKHHKVFVLPQPGNAYFAGGEARLSLGKSSQLSVCRSALRAQPKRPMSQEKPFIPDVGPGAAERTEYPSQLVPRARVRTRGGKVLDVQNGVAMCAACC